MDILCCDWFEDWNAYEHCKQNTNLSYLKYLHLFDGKHSKWHRKHSCNRKTVEFIFSNQLSVHILKVHIPFHISMTLSICAWLVSWVCGLFHVCMAHFKCARAAHRCTTRSKVNAQFLNMSSTCHVMLVVSAVSFPRNLHYFDVTSSHNFRRNFQ